MNRAASRWVFVVRTIAPDCGERQPVGPTHTGSADPAPFAALTDGEFTGLTQVALEVNFNGFVDTIREDDAYSGLFADVFADTLARNDIVIDTNEADAETAAERLAARVAYTGKEGTTLTPVGDGADRFTNTGEEVTVETPSRTLGFNLGVTDAALLPKSRDVVNVAGGTNRVLDDPETESVSETRAPGFRPRGSSRPRPPYHHSPRHLLTCLARRLCVEVPGGGEGFGERGGVAPYGVVHCVGVAGSQRFVGAGPVGEHFGAAVAAVGARYGRAYR